jgi:hypothetical protein
MVNIYNEFKINICFIYQYHISIFDVIKGK